MVFVCQPRSVNRETETKNHTFSSQIRLRRDILRYEQNPDLGVFFLGCLDNRFGRGGTLSSYLQDRQYAVYLPGCCKLLYFIFIQCL